MLNEMVLLTIMESESSSSDNTDYSENEDEEVMNVFNFLFLNRQRGSKQPIENFAENVASMYSEKEFITQFRIGSNVCTQLIQKFQVSEIYTNLFSKPGGRPPISAEKHILTFLYFVGHEAVGYRTVNNIFNMSTSTLNSVISRVADFVCSLGSNFIKWPDEKGINDTKSFFLRNTGIPNVIGIIDGSHVRIDKPTNDPDSYLNRKKEYSVHIQGIVNHERKFVDIFIGFPGSVHDARVFSNSSIFEKLPNICAGVYILGDSAYPALQFLLVPYKDNGHLDDRKKHFNFIHSSAHIYVEHSFGLLKQRFRQLYHLKLRNPRLIVQVIKACCILHNIANVEEIDFLQESAVDMNNINSEDEDMEDSNDGKKVRDEIAEFLWNNR